MKRVLIFTALAFIILLGLSYWLYNQPKTNQTPSMEWVYNYDLKPGTAAMSELLHEIDQWDMQRREEEQEPNWFRQIVYKWYKPKRAELVEIRSLLEEGNTNEAIKRLEEMAPSFTDKSDKLYRKFNEMLAVAYLRWGEQENCIINHSNKSCILPIQGDGVYSLQENTRKAIEVFLKLLEDYPDDWRYRWLVNVGYQTIGEYPEQVPAQWLIESELLTDKNPANNFTNIAPNIGTDFTSNAGGAILEDFNNDGLLDMFTSGHLKDQIKFFVNQGTEGFKDQTATAGLEGLIGGFNLYQLDYNKDGWLDLLVVRGSWGGNNGLYPNSLLKNNQDGTFSDVTVEANILSFHPNANAVCADFNNDGWVDFYLGNETRNPRTLSKANSLYINTGKGSFKEVTEESNSGVVCFTKGLAAGDYNNDGLMDIFVSNHNGANFLLKNVGNNNDGVPQFEDQSKAAGIENPVAGFTPWFWDYNNDGWLDLFVTSFEFGNGTSAAGAAKTFAGVQDSSSLPFVYHNNGDGTFTNKAAELGLDFPLSTMGANFGDVNNDGWIDFYIGTGEPDYMGIHPNRLLVNEGGEKFSDQSAELGVGHIQKGHGISFGDIDSDGDQDILAEMGGEFFGDEFQNALFQNPGNGNNWITLKLVGEKSSYDAIGSRVKIVVSNEEKQRQIFYRAVSSGGSFGANSLQLEVGLGSFTQVDSVIVDWPASDTPQVVTDITVNQFYSLHEQEGLQKLTVEQIQYSLVKQEHQHH